MSLIFDATARRVNHARRFGLGIFPLAPSDMNPRARFAVADDADRAWAATFLNETDEAAVEAADARQFDAWLTRQEQDAEFLSRLEELPYDPWDASDPCGVLAGHDMTEGGDR